MYKGDFEQYNPEDWEQYLHNRDPLAETDEERLWKRKEWK